MTPELFQLEAVPTWPAIFQPKKARHPNSWRRWKEIYSSTDEFFNKIISDKLEL